MKEMKKQGFTLIELLLVVIGIALVLAIVISLLQIPSKEMSLSANVSKILNDVRYIETAWNRYYLEQGSLTTNLSDLSSAAYIKSIPSPPASSKDSSYTGTYAYAIDATTYDISGSTAKDYTIKLSGVNQDTCAEIDRQAGLSSIPSAVQSGIVFQCISSGGVRTVIYLLRAQ